jgi:hypothetical protein
MTIGTSFIDKIRSGAVSKPKVRSLYIAAFDPDLDTTGVATIRGTICGGEYTHEGHTLEEISYTNKRSYNSAKRTWLMAEAIGRYSLEHRHGYQSYLVIEAQEVYRDGKADANDLLRLAQVTGQLQAKFALRHGCDQEIVLPKIWKQNKQKEGMHKRALERVKATDEVYSQHTLDALCLALWKVDQLIMTGNLAAARLTNRTQG